MIQTHCEFGLDTGLNHIEFHSEQRTKKSTEYLYKTANKIQILNDGLHTLMKKKTSHQMRKKAINSLYRVDKIRMHAEKENAHNLNKTLSFLK